MSISFVEVVDSGAAAFGNTEHTISSWTPKPRELYFLATAGWQDLGEGLSEVSGVTGNGATWTKLGNQTATGDPVGSVSLWVCRMPVAPSTGATTIALTREDASFGHVLFRVSGAAWVVGTITPQVQTGAVSAAASATLTLPNPFEDDTNNVTLGVFTRDNGSAITPGTGFTELDEINQTTGTAFSLQVQYQTGEDLSVDWSWTGADVGAGIALEMRTEASAERMFYVSKDPATETFTSTRAVP